MPNQLSEREFFLSTSNYLLSLVVTRTDKSLHFINTLRELLLFNSESWTRHQTTSQKKGRFKYRRKRKELAIPLHSFFAVSKFFMASEFFKASWIATSLCLSASTTRARSDFSSFWWIWRSASSYNKTHKNYKIRPGAALPHKLPYSWLRSFSTKCSMDESKHPGRVFIDQRSGAHGLGVPTKQAFQKTQWKDRTQ